VGSVVSGPVRNITDFICRRRGRHRRTQSISDIHWTKKIKHPSELYKKGDVVEAKVLGVNVETSRFSLGIKQLAPDPWKVISDRFPVGSKIKGQVTSVPDFGVFVRIDEGVEGLIHVSQLSTERVDKPSSLYKVGDEVEAEVINIDAQERKIAF
jgi:small subunit ribosomal protein S1